MKLLQLLTGRPPNLELLARGLLRKPPPGRFFAAGERKTFIALAEVLLEGAPVKVPLESVADNIEGMLLLGRSRRAWRVRVLYNMVEYAPVVLLRKRPFSTLSVAERRAIVQEHFMRGRNIWRICAKARHLVNLGAYADPRANGPLGFVPVRDRERYAGDAQVSR